MSVFFDRPHWVLNSRRECTARAARVSIPVGDSAPVLLLQVPSAGGRDGKESFVTDDAWREHAVHLVSLLQQQ